MHDRRSGSIDGAEKGAKKGMHEYCCCSPWCNCGFKEKSCCDHDDDHDRDPHHFCECCCCCCKPKRKRICYPVYPDICNGRLSCTLSC